MAARLKPRHQDDIRAKIKISNIIDRLEKHVDGLIELSNTQVASARILLDKTMSNAPQITELSGPDGGPQEHVVTRPQLTPEEWAQSHGLGTTKRPTE